MCIWMCPSCVQIALELDRQERAFMAEGGMESEDYLRYVAEDSGNVAADGNFSVQVCGARQGSLTFNRELSLGRAFIV